ncbi:MAG: hypothetical protein LW838_10915, partial [Nitrosomonadaceae bacterium]|nr:hypothetical protein [Nitrosomonadaceae bacterium]
AECLEILPVILIHHHLHDTLDRSNTSLNKLAFKIADFARMVSRKAQDSSSSQRFISASVWVTLTSENQEVNF